MVGVEFKFGPQLKRGLWFNIINFGSSCAFVLVCRLFPSRDFVRLTILFRWPCAYSGIHSNHMRGTHLVLVHFQENCSSVSRARLFGFITYVIESGRLLFRLYTMVCMCPRQLNTVPNSNVVKPFHQEFVMPPIHKCQRSTPYEEETK